MYKLLTVNNIACRLRKCRYSVLLGSTILFSITECCELEKAKSCVHQLEIGLLNWTQSEKCIEFAQNEGNFSKCKNVLEKCPESNKLLERLSKLNAKLASSCPEVCPSYKKINQRCSVDVQALVNGNFTAFCREYTDAYNCAKTYNNTCSISLELHRKAVIKPQLSHIYKTICNKGCSTLEFTIESMESCRWLANRGNCSIVEFDECVQGLNTTLCSGYRRLYAFWFEPTCVPKINQIETQTGSLNDTRTYLTPATNLDTHTTITTDSSNPSLYSTSEKYPQKEGQASSSPITGFQDMCLRIILVAVLTTMLWSDSMKNT